MFQMLQQVRDHNPLLLLPYFLRRETLYALITQLKIYWTPSIYIYTK
jgi:hypothetical protein